MPSRLRIEKINDRWKIERLGAIHDWDAIFNDEHYTLMRDLPPNLANRVALLYTCDLYTDLPGVGYRISQNVFYVEDG